MEVLQHVAAVPEADGSQCCSRCGVVLHKRQGYGAPPPWYPGQLVAASDQARWAARTEQHPPCR
jgi:hypothetical protein